MIYHIIKPGDTIELIAKKYRLTIDEIISINPHFRSWEHLAPGAKLRLPEVSEVVKEELDSIEPFIEDYYPKINIDEILNNVKNETLEQENLNKNDVQKPKKAINKYNAYYYYPYYPYYNYKPYVRKR